MSLQAKGSMGKQISFARCKGRAYAKGYFKPDDPCNTKQTGVRAMMKFLINAWSGLTASQKATFSTLAASWKCSPYEAFIKFNSRRWAAHQMPIADMNYSLSPIASFKWSYFSKTGRHYKATASFTGELSSIFACEFCFLTESLPTARRSNCKIVTGYFEDGGFFKSFIGTWDAPDDYAYQMKARYCLTGGNATTFF